MYFYLYVYAFTHVHTLFINIPILPNIYSKVVMYYKKY